MRLRSCAGANSELNAVITYNGLWAVLPGEGPLFPTHFSGRRVGFSKSLWHHMARPSGKVSA